MRCGVDGKEWKTREEKTRQTWHINDVPLVF